MNLNESESFSLQEAVKKTKLGKKFLAFDFDKSEFHFYLLEGPDDPDEGEWYGIYMSGGECFSSIGVEAHIAGATASDLILDAKDNVCDIEGVNWFEIGDYDPGLMPEYQFERLFSFPSPDEYWQQPEERNKIINEAKNLIQKFNFR